MKYFYKIGTVWSGLNPHMEKVYFVVRANRMCEYGNSVELDACIEPFVQVLLIHINENIFSANMCLLYDVHESQNSTVEKILNSVPKETKDLILLDLTQPVSTHA